ncbi:MAG: 23S rRNA (uracil(1939)-C(5))-methyltransferase RlmD [Lachnospiraceae bacterium]|jgi:23S rRNA (uracil1939-C5)-methyltransferase|nr:23S rRNA (uracil(1939)-C(5))-methyltransferase RlmD [Lachnospiraceae bacterium]
MKKNDTFQLQITDLGTGGEGIGKQEGMTFFVKGALPGDLIEAGVTKLKKTYGYARIVRILEPSEDRVEPICPVAGKCGGCQIMQMDYAAQLRFKERKVAQDLIRIGGFPEELVAKVMQPIIGMEEPYHFRNKAQYPIQEDEQGNPIAGFYALRSHRVVESDRCYLGVDVNEEILAIVKDYMRANKVSAYDETTGKGLLRHVLIRVGFSSKEVMVCLIINGSTLPAASDLIARLQQVEGMTSISVNSNTRRDNVIMGNVTKTLWGSDYITDAIGGVQFQIQPRSFYQVNPVQTEKLYGKALEYANLTGQETVWDLYCGIGTISLFLAQKAKTVYGVEIVPEAIEDAKRNAALNGMDNAHFYVGKAEEVLPEYYEQGSIHGEKIAVADEKLKAPDVIVVDPPRKGCDEKCLSTMVQMAPKRIVYVSCDPATLARDLKFLCAEGYELQEVTPVDQFGHSLHVENAVLLTRR